LQPFSFYGYPIQPAAALQKGGIKGTELRQVPIAVSGNNLYVAWPNNDTGHWNVFFAKSTDGGKTLKTDDKRAQQWKYDRPEYRDSRLRKQRVRNVVDQQDGSTNATIQSK
jgi:hypothetical protein